MDAPSLVGRRPIAGTSVETSVFGFAIDPAPTASPIADRTQVSLMLRARESGVTTFDLSRPRSLPRATQLLRTAFPEGRGGLLVIIGLSAEEPDPGPSRPGPAPARPPPYREEDVRSATVERVSQFAPLGSVFVDWDQSRTPSDALGRTRDWLDSLVERDTLAGWSLHGRPGEDPPVPRGGPSARPVSVELSLLDRRVLGSLAARFAETPGGVLVRNPFADGRLDGSRFSAPLFDRDPTASPINLRSLHADFDPVLRLGPLTRNHRRTLAQAALQYLLYWPWVATVLLPLPAPERWEEIRKTASAPPLDIAELRELNLVPEPPGS